MRRLPLRYACDLSWKQLTGTERARHCAACDRTVHNLSSMTDAEAMATLLVLGDSGICVRFEQDASGDILHRKDPLPAPPPRPTAAVPSGLLAAAISVAACGPAAPAATQTGASPGDAVHVTAPMNAAPAPVSGPEQGGEPVAPLATTGGPVEGSEATAPSPSRTDTNSDGAPGSDNACPPGAEAAPENPTKNSPRRVVIAESLGIPIIPHLGFEFGKHAIRPRVRQYIEEAAKLMNEHPEILRLAVLGHTDAREPHSRKLAMARANAVIDILVKLKVDRRRVVAEAHGAEMPLGSNETDHGRALNRRVEFKVLERTSLPKP